MLKEKNDVSEPWMIPGGITRRGSMRGLDSNTTRSPSQQSRTYTR